MHVDIAAALPRTGNTHSGNMQEVRGSYPALHEWPCAGNAMYLALTNVWGDLAGL